MFGVCVCLCIVGVCGSSLLSANAGIMVRVRGLPERRMQVPVCGTGRGLDNDAGFVVVVLVPSPWPPPGPANNRISL